MKMMETYHHNKNRFRSNAHSTDWREGATGRIRRDGIEKAAYGVGLNISASED